MVDDGDNDSGEEDYLEIFDPDQFVRDGNDIRFQLPSQNPSLTLARNIDEAQRKSTTILRRKTTKKSIVRRKSSKAPPVGECLHYKSLCSQKYLEYGINQHILYTDT